MSRQLFSRKSDKTVITLIVYSLFPFLLLGQSLNAEQLQTDAKILWQSLNELHPGLYRHNDTAILENAYQNLLNDFSTEKSEKEAFLLFSKFAAAVKCGHTYVNPFNQPNSVIKNVFKTKTLLPLYFRIIDNQFIVTASANTAIQSNDVIQSINDIPVQKIIETLTQYIKADGNRYQKKLKDLELSGYSEYEYFDYYFALVFGFKDQIELTLNNGEKVKIDLVTLAERQVVLPIKIDYNSQWDFKIVANKYGHLTIGNFVTWKLKLDWKAFIDDIFRQLAAKNIQNLVIDIRNNEGGNEDVSDYLIYKIAKTKVEKVKRIKHLRYKKVSDNLRPYLSTWNRWFWKIGIWTKKLDDIYRTPYSFLNGTTKIKRNKNAYQDKVFLLTSAVNSSATFNLSETLKQNQLATLVGTETGGTKMGITASQLFFLTLPNSRIEIDIPLIGSYPATPMKDEGILPDIFVKETLEDILEGRDKYIETVLSLIE